MIEYLIDTERQLVVSRMSGVVDFAELLGWHYALVANKDYHHAFSGIADMRKAAMEVSPEQIQELVELNKREQMVSGKWICLVDTPMETAKAMIYKQEKSQTHAMELFSTEEAATNYLALDVSAALTRFLIHPERLEYQG